MSLEPMFPFVKVVMVPVGAPRAVRSDDGFSVEGRGLQEDQGLQEGQGLQPVRAVPRAGLPGGAAVAPAGESRPGPLDLQFHLDWCFYSPDRISQFSYIHFLYSFHLS